MRKIMKKSIQKGHVKVPVVLQLEALECGAACLAMILAYYGKWLPLEQLRADCGISRDGSCALYIIKAAREYGMKAKGSRYEADTIFKKVHFPCIIHWNFNHFVVLCGRRGDKIYINDPGKGPCTVSAKQFDESFTGVCLQFQPGADFAADGRPQSTLAYARRRLKGVGGAIAFTAIITLIGTLFSVIQPAFSRIFFDRILTGQNPEWFYPFLIGFGLLSVLMLGIKWVETIYTLKLNGKLAVIADFNFFWHVLRLPMRFFSQRLTGDVIMRQGLNAGIVNSLIGTFAPLFLETGMMIFYLVVMVRYSLPLSLIGLGSVLVDIVMARIISQKRVNITRMQMRDSSKLSSETMSGIEMIESIKASGAENGFFERWAGYQAAVNNQHVKLEYTNSYLTLIPSFVSIITSTLILICGVFLTIQGEFTVGMIMAFQGFLSNFKSPMNALIHAGQTIQELRTNMERVEDVLQYETDVPESTAPVEQESYQKLSGDLSIRGLTFGYTRFDKPLIENFCLELKRGQSVALVGASACGKSTIAKLISGMYRCWSGEILFDGKPLAAINHSVLTSSLAVVDQDITIFEDTISANIKLWDKSIEGFEAILAARDAKIHEDIMQRDGGYANRLQEGGKDLSGGQRQRLEIARALAQEPTILILDEATSALDSKTEASVVNAIKARGITCIIIAHRLSAVRHCDEIMVLEQGKVVECGTHAQLYKKGGAYTALVSNE